MEHPDFSKAKISPAKEERALDAVTEYLLSVIIPQVPILTGQLRASYQRDRRSKVIGPANTMRWDAPLTNLQLAGILRARGHLNVLLTPGHKAHATRLARAELRGRVFEYDGRVQLGHLKGK